MKSKKSFDMRIIIIAITFTAIVTTGIIYKQTPLRLIPLIVSIGVMLLSSQANRYAHLIGGINSLIYGFAYWSLELYATALFSACVSFPLMIITFINWSRHKYKNSTQFKKMSTGLRIFTLALFIIIWLAIYVWYSKINGTYAFLDNTSSLLGMTVTILAMFAYIENTYINIISGKITIIINIEVKQKEPAHITYLIFSLYSMWAIVMAFINVNKLYKIQTIEKSGEK